MNLKNIVRRRLVSSRLEVKSLLRGLLEGQKLRRYLRKGRIPWSVGYTVYRKELITGTFRNEAMMERFRARKDLPRYYGVGVDERCIELPWLLARLYRGKGILLDAGSGLNHEFVLDHPVLQRKEIYILTLAPEESCFWKKGISYIFCDLRDIPIRDAYYDAIACISTLEHVGFDNTVFTERSSSHENRPDDFVLVMRELRRVLKPGGMFLFTVPFGVYQHFGWFQQYDQDLLHKAIEAFGKTAGSDQFFYRYDVDGWNLSIAEDCSECRYVQWAGQPPDQRDGLPDRESDLAAAAHAVACVELIKA